MLVEMGMTASSRLGASEIRLPREMNTLAKAQMIVLGRLSLVLVAAALIAVLAVGCGSEGGAPTVDEGAVVTIGDRAELRAYTRPGSVFEVNDFIEAGWKKNKEYPLETLPEASAALFGFYNRKDIELRFYPTHEVAMAAGKEAAETAIETEKVSGRGAGFSSVTLYGAYLIAGNVVMLCEFSIQDCTALIDEVVQ